jgi:hypothetical protein
MDSSFNRYASVAALITGILSILYAVFFLGVTRASAYAGTLGSWIILGATAFFAAAAYVGLYQRLNERTAGFSLYAMLFGVMAAFAMLQHGAFEAIELFRRGAVDSALGAPSQVDAAGLASFGVVGVVAFLWGWLIVKTNALPRNLGYAGMFNAFLLVVLFFATVVGSQPLILLSGGLTSVIVGPIWWIWLGRALASQRFPTRSERVMA